MARINKIRFTGWVILLLASLWLGGCTTSMEARSAFEEAEQLESEDKYDEAVEKYFEASQLEPGSKTYKLKMISSRTRAAAHHVRLARKHATEGKLTQAIAEYRLALGFDSSIEIAAQERDDLLKLINAEQLAEEGASFYGQKKLNLAQRAVNEALNLDANNARALAIKDLIDRDLRTVAMDGIELDIASTEPITLSFKDANIKEVFGVLSQLSGINFIFDEEIRTQTISVLLEKASFAQAMELILQMNGLDKKVLNSKTLIIYPQSREKSKQYEDQIIQTFFLSHIDAKKAVNLLRTMLQLRKIYVHEERNAIVIRDKPQVIKLAEQILDAADRANSEVLFALEILSVADADTLNFGPELSTYGVGVGFSNGATGVDDNGNPTGGTILDSTIQSGQSTSNLASSLSSLQTFFTVPTASYEFKKAQASSEVLASPKIRVRNREKAKVHIGTREPSITSTVTDTSTTANIQYIDVGVKVDIEPIIQLDNSVEVKVSLEVSRVIEEVEVADTRALTIQTTNAQTVLTIKDGVQTILGGLFEQATTESETTIPFIGEIPFLGDLFTSFTNEDIKREILLSITPYVIRQVDVPDVDVSTIWSGGEDNLKSGPNFGSFTHQLESELVATKPNTTPAVKPLKIETFGIQEQAAGTEALSLEDEAPVDESVADEPITDETGTDESVADEMVVDELAALIEQAEAGQPVGEDVPTEVIGSLEEIGTSVAQEVSPAQPTVINFDGPAQVEQNEEFAVVVRIKNAEKLYSAPLFVSYDPAALELLNINEGTFLKQDGESTVFSSSPNRTTGQLIVGYKQGASGQGASGAGDLFSLKFKPIAVGETKLEINRVNFRNPEGVRLKVIPEAVTIEVR